MRYLISLVLCLMLAPLGAAAEPAAPPAAKTEVDLALVLAVDISYSMDPEEQAVQRQGYIAALTSPQVLAAIKNGPLGRIAVLYWEWAGTGQGEVVADWRLITDAASARAFAAVLAKAPLQRSYRTSISWAMSHSVQLLARAPVTATRRVIDISGDGPNNEGALIVPTRAAVLAQGIGINGLPIMLQRPRTFSFDLPDLDRYYSHCVIGGPGAFIVTVHSKADFIRATREKLIQEVAGTAPPRPRLVPVADTAPVSCTVGEDMWQSRFRRYNEP
jgi:hypothetical protein